MCARDTKYSKAKALKTKSVNSQHEISSPNSARTSLNTVLNDALSDQRDGEEQIPPQEKEDDQTPPNKKQGEDGITTKQQETEDIDEDRISSSRTCSTIDFSFQSHSAPTVSLNIVSPYTFCAPTLWFTVHHLHRYWAPNC